MRAHGWAADEWPLLWQHFLETDILVIGTPIRLGEESSVCRLIIERLYGMSGGCVIGLRSRRRQILE